MIFLLFVVSMVITTISFFVVKKKFLSPFLATSLVITVFSSIYILNISIINGDIQAKTAMVILLMLTAVGIGEWMANRITMKKGGSCAKSLSSEIIDIQISKRRTVIIFVIMIYAAMSRFYRLFLFTKEFGNNNIFDTIRRARPFLSSGISGGPVIDLTTPDVSVITYLANPICYFYLFWFTYLLVRKKQKRLYLLLPVLGNGLILASSTSRTVFIIIATGFITAYAYTDYINSKKRKISIKLIFFGLLFVAMFFAYGNIVRGVGSSLGWRNTIFAYSSAGIYGLDHYLKEPWQENIIFGQRTLKPIYDLLGKSISIETNNTVLPFYLWGKGQGDQFSSNLYSSLVLPIQDYGIWGMCFARLLAAFLTIWIEKTMENKNTYKGIFFFEFYFLNMLIYSFLNVLIADRFYSTFFDLRTLAFNIIFTFIAVHFVIKWKIIYKER